MKVFVTGTRGIPNIPGGVETHCEKLYPLLVKLGCEITVCRRSSYINDKLSSWNGVELLDIYSPKKKSIEAIVHTFLAICAAKKHKADIIHIHAVGPALLIPFARLLGLKVIFTNHGPDYDRNKWGAAAKIVLKLGEWVGAKFANKTIAISQVIKEIIYKRTTVNSVVIFNGVNLPIRTSNTDYLNTLGIQSGNYIIAVARFVPEKGLHDLINAYAGLDIPHKLVIVGDTDHEDDYSLKLKKLIKSTTNVISTGYIIGDNLNQIFSHASLFVLPSYHEGLPISLLEAMSYGVTPLVSDIPANTQVLLPSKHFFQVKNIDDLKSKIKSILIDKQTVDNSQLIDIVKTNYNWEEITKETFSLYKTVVSNQEDSDDR